MIAAQAPVVVDEQAQAPSDPVQSDAVLSGADLAGPPEVLALLAMLNAPSAASAAKAGDFADPARSAAADVLLNLAAAGGAVNGSLLKDGLIKAKVSSEAINRVLGDIGENVALFNPARAAEYLREVHRDALRRRVVALSESIAAGGCGDMARVRAALDEHDRLARELDGAGAATTPTEIGELANMVISEFWENKRVPAQPTGLSFIDGHLDPGGLPLGAVFLLAARPNVGKSFIGRWIIERTLRHDPKATAVIFDAEQDARHIVVQLAARRSRIPSREFYSHFAHSTAETAGQGQLAVAEVGQDFAGRLHLVCDVLTPELVESVIARVKPTVILIDDLQSVAIDCPGRDALAVDLARAAWVQRVRRMGCAIVATHHQRKEGAADPLDTLFGHSIAAYRSDLVLALRQDADPGGTGAFVVEGLCAKNRYGLRGWTVRFAIDPAVAAVEVQE